MRSSPKPSADRILKAAEQTFARTGYGDASLRQLIAEAQVSTTAFYARFPSKEAVLAALVERFLLQIGSKAAAAIADSQSLDDGFGRGVTALAEMLLEHKTLARLTLTEAAASKPVLQTLRGAYRGMAELIRGKLERLEEKDQIQVADAEALAWALVGALQLQVTRWAVFEEMDDAELSAALTRTALALLPAIGRKQ